ncbi:Expansin [Thalictrum thalictroides]|uniref:Expansin n=1 Tax=Thalictrum thalictroides TaxID=46969 RepID=A0A7J6VT62_THATH|nr:Expansin [Thalictrum thalictroides]
MIIVNGEQIGTGFINTHVHTSQQLARGIADDVDLLTWLHECIWPYESNMTEEDSFISTLLCGIELIRSVLACNMVTGFGAWQRAHATFYGGGDASGTMGERRLRLWEPTDGYGIKTAALSTALFNNGNACGACYQIVCDGSQVPQWCFKDTYITITVAIMVDVATRHDNTLTCHNLHSRRLQFTKQALCLCFIERLVARELEELDLPSTDEIL